MMATFIKKKCTYRGQKTVKKLKTKSRKKLIKKFCRKQEVLLVGKKNDDYFAKEIQNLKK